MRRPVSRRAQRGAARVSMFHLRESRAAENACRGGVLEASGAHCRFQALAPVRFVARRAIELDAGGLGSGGEVEPLGIETDRPPDLPPARRAGEAGERRLAKSVRPFNEARLRLGDRRAVGNQDIRGRQRAARTEAPVKVDRFGASRKKEKSAKST